MMLIKLYEIYVCLPISWVGPPIEQIKAGLSCLSSSQEGWARAAPLNLLTFHPQCFHCTTVKGNWCEETISMFRDDSWTFLSTFSSGEMRTVLLLGQHFLSSDCGVLPYPSTFPFSFNDLMDGIKVAFSFCQSSFSWPFLHLSMSAYSSVPSWQGCHRGHSPQSICSHHELSEAENTAKGLKWGRGGEENKEKGKKSSSTFQ